VPSSPARSARTNRGFPEAATGDVMLCSELPVGELENLLARFGVGLEHVPLNEPIPGSFWGDSEAGLIGNRVLIRPDTPLHSALHEASHFVCMDARRRSALNTDAGGDDLEECAVCYLQILLADHLPLSNRDRMFEDMDAWGYSFRYGSARAWFERDAEDARQWLVDRGLMDAKGEPTWRTRT